MMILGHLIRAWRIWRRYRTCVRELSALSDMELADIGVARSAIHWLAWRVGVDGSADPSSIRAADR